MSRFFVPAVLAATISGLGFGLVVGVIARSPDTHSNVRPEGYERTPVAFLGEESPFEGVGLADPQLVASSDPVERGRLIFFGSGCATCHGLVNQGGVVGPRLDLGELTVSGLRREVRSGPKGMPAFPEESLSDDDLAAIYAFLEAIRQEAATAGVDPRNH